MKNENTNAVRLLRQRNIPFRLYSYPCPEALSGEEIAEKLKKDAKAVFKTLVTEGRSGQNYVFMIPVAEELDLKKAARAAGEKSISMVKAKMLLPLTGYVHGGCSPIGMKKQFPAFIHHTADKLETITFSGGRIGLQTECSVGDLRKIIEIASADLITE
ncbi:MAG: Cys-tRNA(Pro) deacylase [Abditibacteriota bacterium]|nr:Cys-tRNA(Pro) deacylase [Abditibacteriota bacterium]